MAVVCDLSARESGAQKHLGKGRVIYSRAVTSGHRAGHPKGKGATGGLAGCEG